MEMLQILTAIFKNPSVSTKTFSGKIISELFAYLRLITVKANNH